LLHISVGCFFQKAMENSHWASLWCNGLLQIFGQTLFCSVSGSPSLSAPLSQRHSVFSFKRFRCIGLVSFLFLLQLFLMLQWPLETVQTRGLAEYCTVFPNCLAGVALGFVVGKRRIWLVTTAISRFLTEEMREKFIKLSWWDVFCWPCLTNAPACTSYTTHSSQT